MRPRLTLVAITAVLLTGCGQSHTRRSSLAAYIDQVDTVESSMRAPLSAVSQAGKQFALEATAKRPRLDGGTERSRQRSLLKDAARIAALRARLAKLSAPHVAAHLRSLLLQLTGHQLALTREVAKMVLFIPRFSTDLVPLVPAMRRLEPALAGNSAASASVAEAYAAKARALRRFASTLDGILAGLASLTPPAVSGPDYRAQVHALEGMSANAKRLASALSSGRTQGITRILEAFDRAAASNQSSVAQKAQIAAVRAYDAQVAQLTRISQLISAERQQLADTVH